MDKEKVLSILFTKEPDVRQRGIVDTDPEPIKESKRKLPFELFNLIIVTIITNKRKFAFDIPIGFMWDGATIPRLLWFIIGSKTDNEFAKSSMLHDYLLDEAVHIINNHLKEHISILEYIRLTTLIFREKLKLQGVNVIKANIMGFAVHVAQLCLIIKWLKVFRKVEY